MKFKRLQKALKTMPYSTFEFSSAADDLQLQGYAWAPQDAPVAAVQIAHGLGEHSRRYDRFAKSLTAAGFAVYAHDHRGHGGSLIAPGKVGDAGDAGWDGLVADMAQHCDMIRARHDGLPVFLFGHSLGSLAAQHFLLDHSALVDRVVLSGSTDLAVVGEMIAASGEVPTLESYNAAFEPARTPFDWLSRDEAEVDLYVADPLCGFEAAPAFAMSMMGAASQLGDPARLSAIKKDLPILVIAGDADPLNGGLMLLNSLTTKYKAAGLSKIETKYYAGARHEILNETNRDEVTADIIAWLKA